MVSQKEKKQATEFICGKLEDSVLYIVQRCLPGEIIVKEKPEVREQPRTICTLIANFSQPIAEFERLFQRNQQDLVYTVPVFYKDGKTAFVRMVDRSAWREDKSLKKYTSQEINQMIALRGIEKAVMQYWGNELVYFQPKTAQLQESLREFKLKTVYLDYSHLMPDDPGYDFAENRDSIDYKLPEETDKKFPAVRFAFYQKGDDYFKRAILSPAEKRIETKEKARPGELFSR